MANADAGYDDTLEVRNRQLQTLLAACVLRDRRAFAQLYDLTAAKLYGIVLRILNRDDWAQDCLQEAYVKVWNKAEHYRPDIASPITWMATIARNQALDLLRRYRQELTGLATAGLLENVDPAPPPLEHLQQTDEGRRLSRCLEQLPSRQRQVIALAYFKGLSHDELATQTQIPLGTIKTWIRRGLEQLRRCLET